MWNYTTAYLNKEDYKKLRELFENVFEEKDFKSIKTVAKGDKYRGYSSENMYDENKNYIGVRLFFATPGVCKEDLKVTLEENIIHVVCDKDIINFGKLDTKVKINFQISNKNIKSRYENGLLIIEAVKTKAEIKENIINID